MRKEKHVDKFRKYLLVLLAILLVGGGLTFRSFVFTNLVLPIIVLFWAAWRVILSVDQNTFWLSLLVLCALLMIWSIKPGRRQASRLAYGYQLRPANRVEHWQAMIETSLRESNGDSKLRDSLEKLVVSALATSHTTDRAGGKGIIASESPALPPAVRQYLYTPHENSKSNTKKRQAYFVNPQWLNKWKRSRNSPDKAPIEEVIHTLEDFLEIDHD